MPNFRNVGRVCLLAVGVVALLSSCRGTPSERPPIHINPNMDDQQKYEAMEASPLFADGAAMRMPIKGTVARGDLVEDPAWQLGKNARGQYVKRSPQKRTRASLERGRERFDIFCTPCHGAVGDGQGIIAKVGIPQGLVPPTDLHADYLRVMDDGYYFEVISKGVRNMKGYQNQLPVEDRWHIVNYMRALQRSQRSIKRQVSSPQDGGETK